MLDIVFAGRHVTQTQIIINLIIAMRFAGRHAWEVAASLGGLSRSFFSVDSAMAAIRSPQRKSKSGSPGVVLDDAFLKELARTPRTDSPRARRLSPHTPKAVTYHEPTVMAHTPKAVTYHEPTVM